LRKCFQAQVSRIPKGKASMHEMAINFISKTKQIFSRKQSTIGHLHLTQQGYTSCGLRKKFLLLHALHMSF